MRHHYKLRYKPWATPTSDSYLEDLVYLPGILYEIFGLVDDFLYMDDSTLTVRRIYTTVKANPQGVLSSI